MLLTIRAPHPKCLILLNDTLVLVAVGATYQGLAGSSQRGTNNLFSFVQPFSYPQQSSDCCVEEM